MSSLTRSPPIPTPAATPAAQQDRYKKSQAVMWRGFDENLQQGARCKTLHAAHEIRACLRKILQRNFPQRRSSRSVRFILKTDKI
jgi:hypothetical protein